MENVSFFSRPVDELVFWFSALVGTGLFVMQLLLSFFGVEQGDHLDAAEGIDFGKLYWLSKQALSGFLLMFGWVGLTCRKEFIFSLPLTLLIAACAGIVTMFFNGWLFKLAKKLRSTGTVFNLEEAIGREATVYQRIPQGGVGKVMVSFSHMMHEVDAVSEEQEDLPSFTSVYITHKMNSTTVIVVPKK